MGRLLREYVPPVAAVLVLVVLMRVYWTQISSAAETISALATVVSAFIALFAVFFAVWQTQAANRQAEAAEKAIQETHEDRRASARPLLIPVNGPDILESGSVKVDDALKMQDTLSLANEGLGPALNVVVRLLDCEENQLFETEIGFIATSEKGYRVVRKKWGPFSDARHTAYTHVFEAVYNDIYGKQHRCRAYWQNGQWVQIGFDHGGSLSTWKFDS